MKSYMIASLMIVTLAGCATVKDRFGLGQDRGGAAAAAQTGLTAEALGETATLTPETAAPPPPPAASTAEALDTTTPAQRAAAATPASTPSEVLGTTVASLGDPTEAGLWLKTPLVTTETKGRVTNPATGKSSAVTLIPRPGAATAGSQMSLSALRLIGASLTDLTEVEVAREG